MNFDSTALPDDWKLQPIRALTVRTSQRDPRRVPDQVFRYVDVSSVDNTLFIVRDAAELKGADAPSRARKDIKTNDVLFATVRPTLKRIAIIPEDLAGQIASTGYCVLRTDRHKCDPNFLYYFLITDWFTSAMGRLERGASYPAVRDSDVFAEKIPVPPLPEQKKIAHILSTVPRAIKEQERIIQTTTELKKALMQKLFTEGLRGEPQKETEIGLVPESWEVVKLGEIVELRSGGTPNRTNPEFWEGGSIPWVKTGEVDYCEICDTEEKITPAGLAGSSAKLFPPGTLLMAMYGQGITRGKVAILGVEAATNQACVAFFPQDAIRTKFLYYFFEYHYERLRNLGHGANQKNLSSEILKGSPVAYPSEHAEQDAIIDSLEALDRKLIVHLKKKEAQADLFRTLLHELMTAKTRVNELDFPSLDAVA